MHREAPARYAANELCFGEQHHQRATNIISDHERRSASELRPASRSATAHSVVSDEVVLATSSETSIGPSVNQIAPAGEIQNPVNEFDDFAQVDGQVDSDATKSDADAFFVKPTVTVNFVTHSLTHEWERVERLTLISRSPVIPASCCARSRSLLYSAAAVAAVAHCTARRLSPPLSSSSSSSSSLLWSLYFSRH